MTLLPVWAFMACSGVNVTFTLHSRTHRTRTHTHTRVPSYQRFLGSCSHFIDRSSMYLGWKPVNRDLRVRGAGHGGEIPIYTLLLRSL